MTKRKKEEIKEVTREFIGVPPKLREKIEKGEIQPKVEEVKIETEKPKETSPKDLLEKAKQGKVLSADEIEKLQEIITEPIEINIAEDVANTGRYKIKIYPKGKEPKQEEKIEKKEEKIEIKEEIPDKA
jgi:hypothetical protein